MSQRIATIAPRPWAVRLLLVGMLAMCAWMLHAPHGASAAMAQAGHGTSGSISAEAGHQAIADQGSTGTEAGDRCSCCPTPLDIGVACATVNTGPPQQHGALPQALDEDAFVTPDLASSGSTAQRAAPPPSLAELSLLRV